MEETLIICDTNIWYNLGDGKINPHVAKTNHLVATYYNFDELNTTYSLLKDSDKVIRTCSAIVQYSKSQILENAILYLVRTIDPYFSDEKYTYNQAMRTWNEVRLLATLPIGTKLPSWALSMYESNIKNKENKGVSIAATENALSDAARSKAKTAYKKNKNGYYDAVSLSIVSMLKYYLKEFTNSRIEFPEDYSFKQIELFLNAYTEYFFKLDVGGMRVQPNDAYDLYNLIYVQPGMQYYTVEKRWIRIINDAGMGHYLFQG